MFQWTIKNSKEDLEFLMLIVTSLYFILLVLKQIDVGVVVTISMIPMQGCAFEMLLKHKYQSIQSNIKN